MHIETGSFVRQTWKLEECRVRTRRPGPWATISFLGVAVILTSTSASALLGLQNQVYAIPWRRHELLDVQVVRSLFESDRKDALPCSSGGKTHSSEECSRSDVVVKTKVVAFFRVGTTSPVYIMPEMNAESPQLTPVILRGDSDHQQYDWLQMHPRCRYH